MNAICRVCSKTFRNEQGLGGHVKHSKDSDHTIYRAALASHAVASVPPSPRVELSSAPSFYGRPAPHYPQPSWDRRPSPSRVALPTAPPVEPPAPADMTPIRGAISPHITGEQVEAFLFWLSNAIATFLQRHKPELRKQREVAAKAPEPSYWVQVLGRGPAGGDDD